MHDLLDLDRYPLDRPESPACAALAARCREDLARDGMFNLEGFARPAAIREAAAVLKPMMDTQSYTQRRSHNIYFQPSVPGLPADHPALATCDTVNHTLCGDQLAGTSVDRIYAWPPLAAFLARVMGKPRLHPMADPLARVNVMCYRAGEALNWHFDRAQFTTTLLIQAAAAGGQFQYRPDLRSDEDPNYEGVARLMAGQDDAVRTLPLEAGTLNVFKGRNTAHRVTPVEGPVDRYVAVFSYYDREGVLFTAEERLGFYGRAA